MYLRALLTLVLVVNVGFATLAGATQSADPAISPPVQPASGPGGKSETYADARRTFFGEGSTGYWTIVPVAEDGEPVMDQQLPLVIFLHGFSATVPESYGAWLDHLAQRGTIILYPSYQEGNSLISETGDYLTNAQIGIRAALDQFKDDAPNAIDLDWVAVVGHSAGGLMAVQYVLTAEAESLPIPSVLLTMTPGGCASCGGPAAALQIPDLRSGKLPTDLLAVVLTVQEDPLVGKGASERIWRVLSQLPVDQRDFLTMQSDSHGTPDLIAEHNTPQTIEPGQPDALDWYGTWKILDALMTCSFDNVDCDVALGGGGEQLGLGDWSDGTPVNPMTVRDEA